MRDTCICDFLCDFRFVGQFALNYLFQSFRLQVLLTYKNIFGISFASRSSGKILIALWTFVGKVSVNIFRSFSCILSEGFFLILIHGIVNPFSCTFFPFHLNSHRGNPHFQRDKNWKRKYIASVVLFWVSRKGLDSSRSFDFLRK